jgi:hypothetical protein
MGSTGLAKLTPGRIFHATAASFSSEITPFFVMHDTFSHFSHTSRRLPIAPQRSSETPSRKPPRRPTQKNEFELPRNRGARKDALFATFSRFFASFCLFFASISLQIFPQKMRKPRMDSGF